MPDIVILDWDLTVQPKYGHQEGAEIGYNPEQARPRSFHPLRAVVAKTRLCPVYRFRAGDAVSASQWHEAMADAERWPGDRQVSLSRGDLGFGHDAIMAWHEAMPARPKFLFKLKLTRLVRTALHPLKDSDWQGPAILGAWQIAEARIQLTGWKTSRRVIFARTLQGSCPPRTARSSGTSTSTSSPSTSPIRRRR